MGRQVLAVTGGDAQRFLHDLVSNDIEGLDDGAVYAALLSPQGKYLFDFFVLREDGGFWIDVKADRAVALAQRLAMYRLRADVKIEALDLNVAAGVPVPEGAGRFVRDPRHPDLGWRGYGGGDGMGEAEFTALQVRLGVPETGAELIADETYILEAGFERLNGVSFKKGCYVGQEVTARMKHKTELRKGLVRVRVSAPVVPGTEVTAAGVEVGTLYSNAAGLGLAQLRLDRATGPLRAGDADVVIDPA